MHPIVNSERSPGAAHLIGMREVGSEGCCMRGSFVDFFVRESGA
jgi:hypothetical protein